MPDGASSAFTVGKIEEGLAILVSDDLQLVEFPFECLPKTNGPIGVGSIINLRIEHDAGMENGRLESMKRLQDEILSVYGKAPEPVNFEECLSIGCCTHNLISASWKSWHELVEEHGWKANLRSIDIYMDSKLVHSNSDPKESTLRMAGMEEGQSFKVHLVFRTSAGPFQTNTVDLATKASTDFSGLYLSIHEDIDSEGEARETCHSIAIEIGANIVVSDEHDCEVTHMIAPRISSIPADLLLEAKNKGTPIVTTDWLKACRATGRLVPTPDFLLK